jgi:hypothetical protein
MTGIPGKYLTFHSRCSTALRRTKLIIIDPPRHILPRYTEQNKIGSTGFVNTIGAEFVYCKELRAWVFRHPQIKTSVNAREENECSWLLRSPTTFSYNIAEVAPSEGWQVWKGMIDWSSGLSVSCNECAQTSDCSYHGECGVDRVCRCNDAHYGYRCELELPCAALTTEKRGECPLFL